MVRDLEKVQVIILKLEQTSTFHKEMKKYQDKPKVCIKTIRGIRESSLEENQQSVFSSFSTKNGSLPVYSLSRYSACLQQITLILATSYSRQHFCVRLLNYALFNSIAPKTFFRLVVAYAVLSFLALKPFCRPVCSQLTDLSFILLKITFSLFCCFLH